MAVTQTTNTPTEFLRALAKGGLNDTHIVARDTAERVITKERLRLLREIQSGEIESVRDLARKLDRNVSVVSRDLDVLFEADLVEFEKNGRSKIPQLAHENVVVEPLVFDGEVIAEEE